MNAETMTYRIEQSCKDWINNKVTALTLLIHANKRRESSVVLRHQIFVDDIESYFLDRRADVRVWRSIRYLKLYLKCYPYAQAKSHKATAMHMLGIIYCSLGIDEVARLGNRQAIPTLEPITSCQDYLDGNEYSKSKMKIGRHEHYEG